MHTVKNSNGHTIFFISYLKCFMHILKKLETNILDFWNNKTSMSILIRIINMVKNNS